MELAAWRIIGIALLIWVTYDLFAGYTYLHRKIVRKFEPLLYWIVLAAWLAIAVYTLGVL